MIINCVSAVKIDDLIHALQINHEAIHGPLGVQGTLEGFDENDANTVSVTISQLSPYTNYTITLCARTSVGCGNATSTVGQTDEDGGCI